MGICNSILNDMSRSLGLLSTGSDFRRGSCSSQGKIRNFSCMFHGTRPRYCLQRSGSSLIQDDWVLPLPKDLSFLWVHGSSSVTQWLALLPHQISVLSTQSLILLCGFSLGALVPTSCSPRTLNLQINSVICTTYFDKELFQTGRAGKS